VILVVAVVVAIATTTILLKEHLEDFRQFGYLGAFLISFLASATVVAFVPSLWLMIAFSAWLNPFYLGLAAGAGEAVGELVIYTAGRTGHAFFLKDRFLEAQNNKEARGIYPRLQRWIHSKGSVALFLASAIWNPFFSLISATAGATRFPVWKFLGAVWAGKTVKWTIIALLGYAVFGQLVARFVEWLT
jgi:membrane protein DedA with SNARE-associated domain